MRLSRPGSGIFRKESVSPPAFLSGSAATSWNSPACRATRCIWTKLPLICARCWIRRRRSGQPCKRPLASVQSQGQVLLASAGNAVKFTEQGGVCLQTVLAEKRYDAQALPSFEISDSGIGLTGDDPVNQLAALTVRPEGRRAEKPGRGHGRPPGKARRLGGTE